MKKSYVRPVMQCEEFAANEYVAACYKINCNVPGRGSLYNESNGKPGLQRGLGGDDELYARAKACNKWHKGVIRDEDPVANGYWVADGKTYDVFWWEEDLGSSIDCHATLIERIQWETNPNAS